MTKYLHYVPETFLDDLVRGQVHPFIGAGFSRNTKLPPGKEMPDFNTLAKDLAELIPGYTFTTAVDATSLFAFVNSRTDLVEETEGYWWGLLSPGKRTRRFLNFPLT